MPIVFKIAESSEDKKTVFTLRYRVFVEQEQRFSHQTPYIVDMFDSFNETLNIIAFKDTKPIGTIRVVMDGPAGFPADEDFDFSHYIRNLEGRCACFGWLCVLKEYRNDRGLLIGLFKMAVNSMKNMGAKHLVATIHPPLMSLLKRTFNAQRVGDDFETPQLQVPMTPAFLSFDTIPPRSREIFNFSHETIFQAFSERRIYQEREFITKKGEVGEELFFILRGSVRVVRTGEDRKEIFPEPDQYNRIGPGDLLFSKGSFFGELSVLDGGERTSTLIPYSSEVDVMVWSREMFMNQLKQSRDKALQVCKLLGGSLRQQIQDTEVSERQLQTMARILYDASSEGKKAVNTIWLARQCGLWPEDLPKITEKWRDENIISLNGESVEVLAPEQLFQNTKKLEL